MQLVKKNEFDSSLKVPKIHNICDQRDQETLQRQQNETLTDEQRKKLLNTRFRTFKLVTTTVATSELYKDP